MAGRVVDLSVQFIEEVYDGKVDPSQVLRSLYFSGNVLSRGVFLEGSEDRTPNLEDLDKKDLLALTVTAADIYDECDSMGRFPVGLVPLQVVAKLVDSVSEGAVGDKAFLRKVGGKYQDQNWLHYGIDTTTMRAPWVVRRGRGSGVDRLAWVSLDIVKCLCGFLLRDVLTKEKIEEIVTKAAWCAWLTPEQVREMSK